MTPGQFYDELLKFAHQTPFSITSGHRTRKHNAQVNGVDMSYHLMGLAFDLVLDEWFEVSVLERNIRRVHPEWDVIVDTNKKYVHVEVK